MSTRKVKNMSKSNRKPVIHEAPPVVAKIPENVQRDEKGRIKIVAMSMVEWDDTIKAKGLTTKSAMIRYLHGEGYAPSGIAKFLGVIYQHVRNVLNQQLKRPVTQPAAKVEDAGEESANDE